MTFVLILAQCLLVIAFEVAVYALHRQLLILLEADNFNTTNVNEYANASSLSVYHILFMVSQLFNLGMFIDAVSFSYPNHWAVVQFGRQWLYPRGGGESFLTKFCDWSF